MTLPIEPVEPLDATTAHEARREDVAYNEGRLDERRRSGVAAPEARDAAAAAYERGRADGRRRRGSSLIGLLLLVVVVIGAVMIYLAIQNGSFSSGGAVVDRSLNNAAETVKAPVRGAADKAGTVLQNAGSDLKETAGSGKP